MQQPSTASFSSYVDQVRALLTAWSPDREARALAALDGQASERLRGSIAVAARREMGAFFTGSQLASRLVTADLVEGTRPIVDATCGAGDLLLAAAWHLPLRPEGVRATLSDWGQRLHGVDLESDFVRAAQHRIALLASLRIGSPFVPDDGELDALLPHIRVGDGLSATYADPVVLLLNPPYGAVASTATPWGKGRIARAAVFLTDLVERLPSGTSVGAILPDVLRSGSNYAHWRCHVETHLNVTGVEPVGQFDAWTDIDVFLLRAELGDGSGKVEWWPRGRGALSVADRFHVHVGSVVPHRDPENGSASPYITAHDLPLGGEYRGADAVERRHPGRRFRPPFVVLRRTSRPSQHGPRLIPTIVRGKVPVLVENHLVVCAPRDRTLKSCVTLAEQLASDATTIWLNERIRCRHITVKAVREIPLCED